MSVDPRLDNLLDQLAADAPLGRMRSRLDELVSQPPAAVPSPAVRLALAAVVVAAIATALFLFRGTPTPTPTAPAGAVLELLEARSTFERLRGVNAAAGGLEEEPAVRAALLRRLEEDPSLNVRLASLQALLSATPDGRQIDRLLRGVAGQETAIVQAHIGHQLRRRGLLTEAELSRLIAQPGFHAEAREALIRAEDS